jgi:hypothetical protein
MRKANKGTNAQTKEVGMKEEGEFKEEDLTTSNEDKEIMRMFRGRITTEASSLT